MFYFTCDRSLSDGDEVGAQGGCSCSEDWHQRLGLSRVAPNLTFSNSAEAEAEAEFG